MVFGIYIFCSMGINKQNKRREIIILLAILIIICSSIRIHYSNLNFFDVINKPELKDFYRDSKGYNYLFELDPYFYYYDANNERQTALGFISFCLNRFLGYFTDISLNGSMCLIPLIFTIGTVILLFAWVYIATGSLYISFFSALFLAISKKFYYNTQMCYADTNAVNHFMTMLVFLLLFLLVNHLNSHKQWKEAKWRLKCIALSFLLFLSIYIFRLFWTGWYFIVILICVILTIYLLTEYVIVRKRYLLLILIIAMLVIAVFTAYHYGSSIRNYFGNDADVDEKGRVEGLSHLSVIMGNDWISYFLIYSNDFSFPAVVMVSLVILSLFLLFFRKKRELFDYFIFLYLVLMLTASYLNVRFAFFAAIPYCIASAMIFCYFPREKIREKYLWIATSIFCVFIILTNNYYMDAPADQTGGNIFVNDITINAMEYIKDHSEKGNASILAWWSMGHPYHALSDREFPIWQGNYAKYVAGWYSTMYTTENESEAYAVAKSVCGNKKCFFVLSRHTMDSILTIEAESKYPLTEKSMFNRLLSNQTEMFELVFSEIKLIDGKILEFIKVYEVS